MFHVWFQFHSLYTDLHCSLSQVSAGSDSLVWITKAFNLEWLLNLWERGKPQNKPSKKGLWRNWKMLILKLREEAPFSPSTFLMVNGNSIISATMNLESTSRVVISYPTCIRRLFSDGGPLIPSLHKTGCVCITMKAVRVKGLVIQ